ncbi:MAG TPA: acetylornithine deacetylase/succinyl-diaminopimelate desuccinylase family protein [Kiloniellaceae bacterium]|nr:acetylornithine deacetylase/succinyl-diaminopimelate desuccinylase family protein [Kiloniellaceae bacterium]
MERLYRRIEDKRDDAVALTQAMVRIPTVNPPGDAYQACAELLGRRLAARGFEIDYLRAEGTPGDSDRYPRVNLVARREGRSAGPCVHFNGHIDVVEPGHGWSFDPFDAEVRDGKIYGRGTCDMKGGLAAAIVAVEALLEEHPDLPGAIEISGTADEESGGFGGVAFLAKKGFFSKPRVDHVVIPEPLNVDRVCLGHRGVWWAEVETKGRIAHGSMPFLGDSAIRHMSAFLSRCEQELYPKLAEKTCSMPVVPPAARHSSLNFNSLHGGLGEDHEGLPSALVADSCRLVLDRRFLLGETLVDVKQEVLSILEDLQRSRPGFRFEIRDLMTVQPQMTAADAPVVQAVSAAVTKVLGRAPEHVVSPGTYDQKHITRIGHLQDCIAYGPGILDLAHQPDEFIVIDDMVQSAKVMAAASLTLLGGAAS